VAQLFLHFCGLEATLKWFKRDKSPGLDGWLVEFYLSLFETIGANLLKFVDDSGINGKIYEAFNTKFIALIPKSDNPASYDDFWPISLCNFIYKIMAKIIANRLCPILSTHISPDKFAFLQDRQIHAEDGTAQEALHSLQSKKMKVMILKVDLSKAFDIVSWLYIRMLLTHLGFPYQFIKWIMCYITNISFSVLVNGAASPLFHSKRGLRQGFPLSPLLFLLIMDVLSRLIKEEHNRGRLQGIKITDRCILTHLLFVDDVLIFLHGGTGDLTIMKNTFSLFQTAIGMIVNCKKPMMIAPRCSPHEIQFSLQRFHFTLQ